jgi:hypothetical protein
VLNLMLLNVAIAAEVEPRLRVGFA